MTRGIVYLIGAGPGDPKLITVRGQELLCIADVVVYDRLAHPALLRQLRPDAEQVYVGKASAHHAMKQSEINALLIDHALRGKRVARLKGGDPFVFGRGGEEAEACRKADIPFEIVPGITSAIAAPAYAGIPVTHRDAASSFAVITGHERDDAGEAGTRAPGKAEGRRNWAHIANAADTLVFLMGVESLPEISARLQEHGRSPDTPAALVQWGTWPGQRVVTGTLATLMDQARRAQMTPPAVCIVGEVVRLRESLRWFDDVSQRPLYGKRILVTRAREQVSALSDLLRSEGAEPIEFPVIKIVPREDLSDLDHALRTLERYDWVVLTSANAIPILAERIEALGRDTRLFASTQVATIGPATAEALYRHLRIRADFMPDEAVAEAILDQWPDTDLTGKRLLLPRAREARDVLPNRLRDRGADVVEIPIYDTVLDASAAHDLRARLREGTLDVLTFASSSTVRNFAHAITGGDPAELPAMVGDACIAAIGPITAETVRELGLTPHILASEHTIPGLVEALKNAFRRQSTPV
jgi:uroporphyrinogen III methyltransferase/synthase